MSETLARLLELEAGVHYKTPAPEGQPDFCYHPGRAPVLISAPHGAAHTRRGRVKDEEDFTTALAMLLAERTGAHAICACWQSDTDTNYVSDTPYKQALAAAVQRWRIRFVLDLHGAAFHHEFGLALGTLNGASCPVDWLLVPLARFGFGCDGSWLSRLDVDQTFTGLGRSDQETITRFAREQLHLPAAQIEINALLRVVRRQAAASEREPFAGPPEEIERCVDGLTALVDSLIRRRRPNLRPPWQIEAETDNSAADRD
ncbi:MAG TPA: hypothetical protein PKG95_13990 [Anaerolineaceae bacterium]|jgi:hypothetical protein|nr:hypothetical protein [Anaerolineaceae bacterium]